MGFLLLSWYGACCLLKVSLRCYRILSRTPFSPLCWLLNTLLPLGLNLLGACIIRFLVWSMIRVCDSRLIFSGACIFLVVKSTKVRNFKEVKAIKWLIDLMRALWLLFTSIELNSPIDRVDSILYVSIDVAWLFSHICQLITTRSLDISEFAHSLLDPWLLWLIHW